jgi:simple sugar transport system ATP-binding protein
MSLQGSLPADEPAADSEAATSAVPGASGVSAADSRATAGEVAIAGLNVAKRFGHVQALSDASATVHKGEVVALFGDNGAGKSTYLKSLLGIVHPDSGSIFIDSQPAELHDVRDAQRRGVDCVHQDLALPPDLSVVDTMYLGHEVLRRGLAGRIGVLARRQMTDRADAALRELSIKLPSLRIPARDLSGGQRQAVAVARAFMWSKVAVLMDEPTAALGVRQSELVCDLMRQVAGRGLGVLVVSHDIPRVLAAADRVVIFRRGRTALDEPAADLTVPDVVSAMVGYGMEVA